MIFVVLCNKVFACKLNVRICEQFFYFVFYSSILIFIIEILFDNAFLFAMSTIFFARLKIIFEVPEFRPPLTLAKYYLTMPNIINIIYYQNII